MITIRYLVMDVDTAIAFYTEALQFRLEERWGPAFAILAKENLRLWLSGPQSSAAQPTPDGRHPEPGGWNRIVLHVDDIESTAVKLRQSGVTFRNEILKGTGGKQVILEDPSGNPIELFEPAG